MNTYVERELTADEIREREERFAIDVQARAELYGISLEQAADELRRQQSGGATDIIRDR